MDLNPVAAFADVPIGAPVARGDITQFGRDANRVSRKPSASSPRVRLAQRRQSHSHAPDILAMQLLEAARGSRRQRIVYRARRGERPAEPFGDRLHQTTAPGTSQYAMHKMFNEFGRRSTSRTTACRSSRASRERDGAQGCGAWSTTCRPRARPRAASRCTAGAPDADADHVEDIAEIFLRVLMAEAPRHHLYNSGGFPRASASSPTSCGDSFPTQRSSARRVAARIGQLPG
jgi:hypothetical protein